MKEYTKRPWSIRERVMLKRALLQDVCSRTAGESIAQSHGKLNTQTSSVPT